MFRQLPTTTISTTPITPTTFTTTHANFVHP